MNRALCFVSSGLVGLTFVLGVILSGVGVFAEDVRVSNVNVAVPASCELSGTGTLHSANVNNGTYQEDIGKTTLTVFCNDGGGYALYAVGFTGEEVGGTDSTKLIGANSDLKISTGTYTQGTTTDSVWSMKVSKVTDTSTSYSPASLTIENGFSSYSAVPADYTKVASFTSTTDLTLGSKLETTYAAFMSGIQRADVYNGKVKYILVHPSNGPQPVSDNQIGVIFDGNGETFPGGAETNRVVYEFSPMYASTNPAIVKTSNVDDLGNKTVSYSANDYNTVPLSFTGADKVAVELKYGMTANTMSAIVLEGNWDGDWDNINDYNYEEFYSETLNLAGEKTYIFDNDVVTIYYSVWGAPESNYDYGFYAKVIPLYLTEQPDTEESFEYAGSMDNVVSGAYATTTNWAGSWYTNIDGRYEYFSNNNEVVSFLEKNVPSLVGSSIYLHRSSTFSESFARNNKTQSGGYYTIQDLDYDVCATTAIGQNITVKDVRDGNLYMVGRLEDGNCWMLENLRLNPLNAATAANMNASNTNAPDAAIYNLLNGGNPNSISGWNYDALSDTSTAYSNIPSLFAENQNNLVTAFGPAAVNGQAKTGVFYNYCAATVGTYCYRDAQYLDVPGTLVDAPYSVCPNNWRLPTGTSSGEFANLYRQYGDTLEATNSGSFLYNFSIALSGVVSYNFGPGGADEEWSGWSSTDYGAYDDAYYLYASEYSVELDYDSKRFDYYSVRCILGH